VEREFMSTIPNSAMPHTFAEPEAEQSNGSSFLFDNARRLAETARENPKTALAVGAGVVAATAAATMALSRGRGESETGAGKGRKRKS
jgi:hypothetical protein